MRYHFPFWWWRNYKLSVREQEILKNKIRVRLLKMDKRRLIPKPRVRYKLYLTDTWRWGRVYK